MALRLISKKNDSVGVTVDVDAVEHHKAFHEQSGAVFGFSVSLSSGYVVASKGLLSVRGFLFETTETTQLFNLAAYSVSDSQQRGLYLKISYNESTRDTSFEFVVNLPSSVPASVNIEQNAQGDCYYEIARFTKNGSTIASFSSSVKGISVSVSSGGTGLHVPEPRIKVVGSGALSTSRSIAGMAAGDFKLENFLDYDGLKNRYEVKMVFLRRHQKVHYKNASQGGYNDSHWSEFGTLHSSNTHLHQNFSGILSLSRGEFTSSGFPISSLISNLFFVQNGRSKSALDVTAISSLPSSAWIRATRSKVQYEHNSSTIHSIRHNFVEIAIRIDVHDAQTGELLGSSAMSSPLLILPIRQYSGSTLIARRFLVKMG